MCQYKKKRKQNGGKKDIRKRYGKTNGRKNDKKMQESLAHLKKKQ